MSSLCYSARQYGKDVVLGFVHMGIQQFSSHASEAWDGKSNTSTVSVCVCVCVCMCVCVWQGDKTFQRDFRFWRDSLIPGRIGRNCDYTLI